MPDSVVQCLGQISNGQPSDFVFSNCTGTPLLDEDMFVPHPPPSTNGELPGVLDVPVKIPDVDTGNSKACQNAVSLKCLTATSHVCIHS